jgi:hypothetical protein
MKLKTIPMAVTWCAVLGAFACHAAAEGWTADPGLCDSLAKKRPFAIFHEDKVPPYILPDPLVALDGTKIANAEQWRSLRRPEILELFRTHVYGRATAYPGKPEFKLLESSNTALNGMATRKQVSVLLADGLSMEILIYLPNNAKKPVPVFTALNFQGNHSIHTDPAIRLSDKWMRSSGKGVVNNRAKEEARGAAQSRWPVEKILARGFGVATIYYGDIDPDFDDGFKNGVHGCFDGERTGDSWASVGAWAWGLSRAMDYFETDRDINEKQVAVMGHSRLGKTSLWAGAQDERFAIVVSNSSGCGGAALSRRRFGESVERINTSFPHWFCGNFKNFNGRESELPVDQHMLIALIAPRPVYVASADEDLWADPRGEFLSALHADPVYRMLGTDGLPAKEMPALNQSVQGTIGYHVRAGKHDVTDFDWETYMDFAERHFQ